MVPATAPVAEPLTPSPTTPAKPPRVLPPPLAPRSVLTALDQLRKPHALPALHAHITTVVAHASPYTMQRLLNGLSASHNATRLNYALALTALSRATSSTALLAAANTLYAAKGTFDLSYAAGPRERAVAAVASLAAITAPTPVLPLDAVLSALATLRSATDASAARWALSSAAARVALRLLACVAEPDRPSFADALRDWVTSNPAAPHALHLALHLRTEGLLTAEKFRSLYPGLGQPFSTALLAIFDTGFSTLPAAPFASQGVPGVPVYEIPAAWRLAIEYALSRPGVEHLGGLSTFWHRIVLGNLTDPQRGPEKRLLAIHLLLHAVQHLTSVEDLQSLLHPRLAALIATVRRARRSPGERAAPVSHASVLLAQTARAFGERLLRLLRDKPVKQGKRPHLRLLLLWSVRQSAAKALLPTPVLVDALGALSPTDATTLLAEAVVELAQPQADGPDRREVARVCNSTRRPELFRFLFALARVHPVLEKDVIRVVVLYCVFEQAASLEKSVQGKGGVVRFDKLRFPSHDASYGGVLPIPSPSISAHAAASGFRRLLDYMTVSRSDVIVGSLPTSCLVVINEVMSPKHSSLVPRNGSSETGTAPINPCDIQSVVTRALEAIGALPVFESSLPIIRSLRVVTQFLALYMYEPLIHTDKEQSHGSGNRESLFGLFGKVEDCVNSLKSAGKIENASQPLDDGDSVPEDEEPQPVEQVTHLIAELCGRDAASCRNIALMGIEALTPCLDDRVVAVLFDAMESFLLGGDIAMGRQKGSEDDEGSEAGQSDSDSNEQSESDEEAEPRDTASKKGGDLLEMSENREDGASIKTSTEAASEGGSDSEADVDIDMDIDKEDPAVLAALDKHLGAHLQLLKEDKKAASKRKLQMEFKYTRASRILDIIEAVGRSLRMRLEKSADVGKKTPLVFLDLHVRLYEFVLGADERNVRFLKQITAIIEKQMLMSPTHLTEKVTDAATAMEIVDRFFEAIRTCSSIQRVTSPADRTISRSAGSFIGIVAKLSPEGPEKILPVFEEITNKMLHGVCFWTPSLFSSIVQKAPAISLRLLPTVLKFLESENVSKKKRILASEIILALSSAAGQLSDGSDPTVDFWNRIHDYVLNNCTGACAKQWHVNAYKNMLHVCANGVKCGLLPKADDLVPLLISSAQNLQVPNTEKKKLATLLRKRSEKGTDVAPAQPRTLPYKSPKAAKTKKRKLQT